MGEAVVKPANDIFLRELEIAIQLSDCIHKLCKLTGITRPMFSIELFKRNINPEVIDQVELYYDLKSKLQDYDDYSFLGNEGSLVFSDTIDYFVTNLRSYYSDDPYMDKELIKNNLSRYSGLNVLCQQ